MVRAGTGRRAGTGGRALHGGTSGLAGRAPVRARRRPLERRRYPGRRAGLGIMTFSEEIFFEWFELWHGGGRQLAAICGATSLS